MKAFTKFFPGVVKVIILLFLISSPILYFNMVVDPYGVFFNNPQKSRVEPNNRYLKLNFILKNPEKFYSYIFGSSRVNFLNPEKIHDQKYFNMSYSMGMPKNHVEDIELMISRGVKIKNLMVGLDYFSLLENPENSEKDLLRKEYPTSLLKKVKFFSSYLFYRPSWEFVEKYFMDHQGADRSKIFISGIATNSKTDHFIAQHPKQHIQSKEIFQPNSKYTINPEIDEAIDEIKKLVYLARENNIHIEFFIHPTHHLTYLHLNIDKYFYALRKLAELTDYCDFSGLNSVATDNVNFLEPNHYRQRVGDLVIAKLFDQVDVPIPDDFGRLVNKNNIEIQILFHRSLIHDYYENTSMNTGYQSPITLSQLIENQDSVAFTVDKINEMNWRDVTMPMHVATPWLKLKGRTINNNTETLIPHILVQIGERLFLTNYTTENEKDEKFPDEKTNLGLGWEATIPTSLIEEGIQEMKFVILNDDHSGYFESGNMCSLNIIHGYVSADESKLIEIDKQAKFSVDKINGVDAKDFRLLNNVSFIHMYGWAIDPVNNDQSARVIVGLDGKEYLSQFIYKRPDVNNHFNISDSAFVGWGVTIPCDNSELGRRELTFKILNKSYSGFYQVKRKINFYDENYFSADANIDLLKDVAEASEITKFSIDIINGKSLTKSDQPIVINEPELLVIGWAVDHPAMEVASNVIVEIDGKQFYAVYGLNRPDVALAYKNERYENSGWRLEIPTDMIGEGEHQLTLKIIAKNKLFFYKIDQQIAIKII